MYGILKTSIFLLIKILLRALVPINKNEEENMPLLE
jgi:hypothetical protein